MVRKHRRRIRPNVCCDGLLPIWSTAYQIDGPMSVSELVLPRRADRIAWREGLKLAVRDLEQEPHAGGENLAGPWANLDPLAGIGRKPDAGSGDSTKLRVQDLVDLLSGGPKYEITFFESRNSH